jgi:hypothetical protein
LGKSSNELTYILAWESLADRELKWTAFQEDPAWHRVREESERDGPIVATISSQILTPTPFLPEHAVAVASRAPRSILVSQTVQALDRTKSPRPEAARPSRAEVEAAVRTIIRWTGEDPERDGLIETPARVTRSFEEFFSGYQENPADILEKSLRGDRRV